MTELRTYADMPAEQAQAVAAYGKRLRDINATPGWELFTQYVQPRPRPDITPAIWPYRQLRPCVLESATLVSAEQAERRVVTLENPGLPGQGRITGTLTGSLQLVMPGEMAPAHRHAASAFRFVFEGELAHTTIDGELVQMRPGDFAITPPWAWHDHRNVGELPMIWLDGLDLHLVNYLGANFAEPYKAPEQPIERQAGSSNASAGPGLLPISRSLGSAPPLYAYPLEPGKEALNRLADSTDPDPWHGYRMRHINPHTGGWALPTIATTLQLLPRGLQTSPYRSTEAAVYVVVEGRGKSVIDGVQLAWEPHDIFVAPNWALQTHHATEDAVIFCYSDRAALEALQLFREDLAPETEGAKRP